MRSREALAAAARPARRPAMPGEVSQEALDDVTARVLTLCDRFPDAEGVMVSIADLRALVEAADETPLRVAVEELATEWEGMAAPWRRRSGQGLRRLLAHVDAHPWKYARRPLPETPYDPTLTTAERAP